VGEIQVPDHIVQCVVCGARFRSNLLLHRGYCPRCGGIVTVRYEGLSFRVDPSGPGIWRYASLLPAVGARVSLGEGLTPIQKLGEVLVKNERANPTGSYSDRASALIASYIASVRAGAVATPYVEDFTRSLLYYLSHADHIGRFIVVVSDVLSVPSEDVLYFISKGVEVVRQLSPTANFVEVDYLNPLTIEGLKTIVLEIYEEGVEVDSVVVPAETGLLAFSIWKGIQDLKELGYEANYEVVAVLVGERDVPNIISMTRDIRVVRVSDEEAYEATKKLLGKGIKAKPLSAASYYIGENLGRSIAVITAGFKQPARGRYVSEVRKVVREVLSRKSPLTAYNIWKEKPVFTLRGIYRAVKSMEQSGELCYEVSSHGKRKIKLYYLC